MPTPQMELLATIAISPAHRVPCLGNKLPEFDGFSEFEDLPILVGSIVSWTGITVIIIEIVARLRVVVIHDVGIAPFESVVENGDLDSLTGVAGCPCG